MGERERDIVNTNDLDGIHFRVLPSAKFAIRLFRKDLELPERNRELGEFSLPEGFRGFLIGRTSILYHRLSPVNKEALEGLEMFKQAAIDNERQISFVALSGRERYKHPETIRRLSKTGHMNYFTDLYLNEGDSASSWKENKIRELVQDGYNVVHIEDEIRPGLCVARVDEEFPDENRVLVYMKRNISNHSWLVRRSGVEIPENMIFVKNFKDAAEDFSNRVKNKNI